MTYQNRAWAHVVFWIGVLLFVLALPFLTFNRGDLALFCLIAGAGPADAGGRPLPRGAGAATPAWA